MGLFDTLVSAAMSNHAEDGQNGNLLTSVMGFINRPEIGGLQGLLQKAASGGLKEQVASWVGTGQNLPVSAEQIQAALGSDVVRGFAEKLGVNPDMAANSLASMLPTVVDQLTPNGVVPDTNNEVVQQGLAALTGLFGQKSSS
ncbi:MAG: YidB family protein [Gallionella sp.]|nr:YidB family protein [Gallionella sp.]MDD4958934.1 YidB family protein [Gallionella sp.]